MNRLVMQRRIRIHLAEYLDSLSLTDLARLTNIGPFSEKEIRQLEGNYRRFSQAKFHVTEKLRNGRA